MPICCYASNRLVPTSMAAPRRPLVAHQPNIAVVPAHITPHHYSSSSSSSSRAASPVFVAPLVSQLPVAQPALVAGREIPGNGGVFAQPILQPLVVPASSPVPQRRPVDDTHLRQAAAASRLADAGIRTSDRDLRSSVAASRLVAASSQTPGPNLRGRATVAGREAPGSARVNRPPR